MGRPLLVEADGGSRGNPGIAGYGALVRDAVTGALLAERAEPLGTASNNVAEYSGLIAGLEAAAEVDPGADVDVALDSKLVVEQMSGRWKIKHEDMRRLALQARDLAAEISARGGSVSYRWIPREQNKDADALSNVAMDGQTVHRGPARDALDAAQPSADGPPAPQRGPSPARVVLVRHGVTPYTLQSRLDGRGGSDPSLAPEGIAQAQRAGRAAAHLLAGGGARVVTSSLARARETGARVAEAIGTAAEPDPRWDEQAFGDWDGATIEDLARDHAADLARLRSDPTYARPGGESQDELTDRVLEAFGEVVAGGGTTVVVCHRKPIMVVLADLLGMDHEHAWRLAAAPGSLTAVEVWPDGGASVAFTNRV